VRLRAGAGPILPARLAAGTDRGNSRGWKNSTSPGSLLLPPQRQRRSPGSATEAGEAALGCSGGHGVAHWLLQPGVPGGSLLGDRAGRAERGLEGEQGHGGDSHLSAGPSCLGTLPFPWAAPTPAPSPPQENTGRRGGDQGVFNLPVPWLAAGSQPHLPPRRAEPSASQPCQDGLPVSPALARASLPLLLLLRHPKLERCRQWDAALHPVPRLAGSQPPRLQRLVDAQRQHLESLDHIAGVLG